MKLIYGSKRNQSIHLWIRSPITCQNRVLVPHNDLSIWRSRLSATSSVPVHRQSRVRVNCRRHAFALRVKGNQLLVGHLVDLIHLGLGISSDELFDNHESTTNTNDELAIQNLGVDLLRTKEIETVSNFSYWHRAVCLVDVMAKHLIK